MSQVLLSHCGDDAERGKQAQRGKMDGYGDENEVAGDKWIQTREAREGKRGKILCVTT